MKPDDQNQPTATPPIPSFDLDLPPLTKTETPETTVTVSAPTPISPEITVPTSTPTAEDLGFPKFEGSVAPPPPTVKVETTPGGMTDEVSTTVTLPESGVEADSGLPGATPTPTVKVETTPGGMTDEVQTTVSLPTPPSDEPPQQVEVKIKKKSNVLPIVGGVVAFVLLVGAAAFALRGPEIVSTVQELRSLAGSCDRAHCLDTEICVPTIQGGYCVSNLTNRCGNSLCEGNEQSTCPADCPRAYVPPQSTTDQQNLTANVYCDTNRCPNGCDRQTTYGGDCSYVPYPAAPPPSSGGGGGTAPAPAPETTTTTTTTTPGVGGGTGLTDGSSCTQTAAVGNLACNTSSCLTYLCNADGSWSQSSTNICSGCTPGGVSGSTSNTCKSYNCPEGDPDKDGQCKSNMSTSCSEPACGQIDFFDASGNLAGFKFTGGFPNCGGGGGGTTAETPTTQTTTPVPACVEVKTYTKDASGNWVVATPTEVNQRVKVGDTVRLAVRGQSGTFTQARFTINAGTPVMTTTFLNGEYVYDYLVATAGAYTVQAEVFAQ